MPAIKIIRYEQVWQRSTITWGEPELEKFKANCQRRAENADNDYNKNYYPNLFSVIKDMSIDEVMEDYQKWRYEEDDCILVDIGPYDVPLGEIIQDELTKAIDDAEAYEDSVCDCDDLIEYLD